MYQFDQVNYQRRMEWYQKARFGMFIHFGLYAIPGRGEWVRSVEEMTQDDYDLYFQEFNPVDCNPKEWVRMAKEAGMKYIVLTAKHHDGFCLYDSKYTDYKITNTPYGRDLVRDFLEEGRKAGLKVGLYFSLLDWHHEDYPHWGDENHPMRNHPECRNENRVFQRYLTYLYQQVEELCSHYGKLDLLWFDFSYGELRGEAWGATKLIEMVRRWQPDVIIDNRLEVSGEGRGSLAECKPTPYHGDFVSPEQMIPPEGILDVEGKPLIWEACVTMNQHWGYCSTDFYYKPADLLIKKLVECVSKGGNLLLNVGPDARGKFPDQSVKILQEIGQWMAKYGESIYGCGSSNRPKPDYGRITGRDQICYLHMFENTLGPVPLIGFQKEKIKAIRRVDTGAEVPVSKSWVHSDYPEIPFADLGPDPILPNEIDYVLKIEMRE